MASKDKIQTLNELKELRKNWKEEGKKVVFTNGCFDIIHLGHVDYLEKAAAFGHKMILGLNTDASVSKLKGPSRPINSGYARARVLAAMSFIDAVVLFGEETPFELISALIPDVLVKGSDYEIKNIVGADIVTQHGGEVKTIDFVEGFSTTSTIDKMKKE
ncbi:D-glycero-beta-D-manno-heptose 1-phosphate adenylyltransferase [Flammeovirgaceae bacterium SG7u.111]|nr:D-glycero-beta-D-manno-heptose 1-phosphate adenylyltransferase [Flammeovirgaceae bacterium SG7u.132]WPO37115.1 D-glycero-beta-D-manno-heptose 1-phosphate adenylyltransferase [Flammeovirgaceae bacterium SG7u.111]